MNFDQVHIERQGLLLECISGSRAYGLQTPTSDTDIKGVFVAPKRFYYGLNTIEQLANEKNDLVYYELKRFIDLLAKNNPNILELLNTPEDSVLCRHPLTELIKPELFISKLCRQTFAGYAFSQIKKAKGLNKKIINPVEEKRKNILDFCYVVKGLGTTSLRRWLSENDFEQEDCGLVSVPHIKDLYAVFHRSQSEEARFKGIFTGEASNDVLMSAIPKGINPLTVMSFNKDGYSTYCKDYKEYWDWVKNRNETRYENTMTQGKNYDAKNMMHTFRLLNMAEEIAVEGKINVRRHDRDFLLAIKDGQFEYDDLVKQAQDKVEKIEKAFDKSSLQDAPDMLSVEKLLVVLREEFYKI